jgi:hypothetical protein
LHSRASRLGLLGTALFCAYDLTVLLPDAAHDDSVRAALQYDAEDSPAFWALKVRAMAVSGLHNEARAALRTVPPARLSLLPCSSQYLGTLGHLTRAVLLLAEPSYYGPLATLLERYPEHFAAHLFCPSDGAVAQLRGMLAHASDQSGKAIEHLERAVDKNERAGLVACAAEARLLLARCLLQRGDTSGTDQALTLARSVRACSGRLGMTQLGREASAVLLAAGAS